MCASILGGGKGIRWVWWYWVAKIYSNSEYWNCHLKCFTVSENLDHLPLHNNLDNTNKYLQIPSVQRIMIYVAFLKSLIMTTVSPSSPTRCP